MTTREQTVAQVKRCPDCDGDLTFEQQSWQCPDCGYIPNHPAD